MRLHTTLLFSPQRYIKKLKYANISCIFCQSLVFPCSIVFTFVCGSREKTDPLNPPLYYTVYILQNKKRRHKPPFIFDKTYREELKISLYVISHSLFCVAKPGLEPRQTEPESVVLPLHHLAKIPRSIRNRRAPISRKRCKITAFF